MRSTSSSELAEIMAYFEIEPDPLIAADVRMAIICSMFANAHRAKGSQHFGVDMFRLFERNAPTADEIAMKLKSIMG